MNLTMRLFIKYPLQITVIFMLIFFGIQSFSQTFPNPYLTVENRGKLPHGKVMVATGKLASDAEGEQIVLLHLPGLKILTWEETVVVRNRWRNIY